MNIWILIIFFALLIFRLFTIFFISVKNEIKLKKNGAKEYGKMNSILILITINLYNLICLIEGVIRKTKFDIITVISIIIFIFSYIILVIVIISLKEYWTTKLIIANNHRINKSFLFKYFRHPNYFFNMIPELFAIGLLFKSWLSMLIFIPIILLLLLIRIIQEEKIMKLEYNKKRG